MIRLEGLVGEDFTAGKVAWELDERRAEPVDIVVNSPGGSATEGAAIFAEIRAHPAPVTIRVRGLAASAASLLAMAGDTVLVAPGSTIMLHDPMALTMGNADVHRSTIEMLEQLSATYAALYAEASGNSVAQVRAWMRAESWLTPEEAVALGFADAMEPEPEPMTMPSAVALAHRPAAAFLPRPILTI